MAPRHPLGAICAFAQPKGLSLAHSTYSPTTSCVRIVPPSLRHFHDTSQIRGRTLNRSILTINYNVVIKHSSSEIVRTFLIIIQHQHGNIDDRSINISSMGASSSTNRPAAHNRANMSGSASDDAPQIIDQPLSWYLEQPWSNLHPSSIGRS